MASNRRGRVLSWLILIIGISYLLLPLITTFEYSLRAQKDTYSLLAYQQLVEFKSPPILIFSDPFRIVTNFPPFYDALFFSCTMALLTILVSTLIIVPTVYWVHLRLPQLRPVIEFLTAMPFVVPGVVLTFGLLRTYSGPPFRLTNSEAGTIFLLVCGYTITAMPYTFRAVDTGMRAIDVRTLTEAARNLGASWATVVLRVILPNLRTAVLGAAFLTFAIAIGEYSLSVFLFPDERAFGPFIAAISRRQPYQPAALTIISFIMVWIFILLLQWSGRGSTSRVQVTGGR